MRDIEGNNLMVRERLKINTPEGKEVVNRDDFINTIEERLQKIQQQMFDNANNRLQQNIRTDIDTKQKFAEYFANSNEWIEDGKEGKVAFVRGKWCADPQTEEILKAMKITIRCIPFDQSNTEGECLLTGKKATMDVIYSRCY